MKCLSRTRENPLLTTKPYATWLSQVLGHRLGQGRLPDGRQFPRDPEGGGRPRRRPLPMPSQPAADAPRTLLHPQPAVLHLRRRNRREGRLHGQSFAFLHSPFILLFLPLLFPHTAPFFSPSLSVFFSFFSYFLPSPPPRSSFFSFLLFSTPFTSQTIPYSTGSVTSPYSIILNLRFFFPKQGYLCHSRISLSLPTLFIPTLFTRDRKSSRSSDTHNF